MIELGLGNKNTLFNQESSLKLDLVFL